MTFDPTKPVQCDGEPARIICTDAKGPWSIVALVSVGLTDGDMVCRFYPNGRSASGRGNLVNIPETVTTYQNVYPDGMVRGEAYSSRSQADSSATPSRIAVLILRTTNGVPEKPELDTEAGR